MGLPQCWWIKPSARALVRARSGKIWVQAVRLIRDNLYHLYILWLMNFLFETSWISEIEFQVEKAKIIPLGLFFVNLWWNKLHLYLQKFLSKFMVVLLDHILTEIVFETHSQITPLNLWTRVNIMDCRWVALINHFKSSIVLMKNIP